MKKTLKVFVFLVVVMSLALAACAPAATPAPAEPTAAPQTQPTEATKEEMPPTAVPTEAPKDPIKIGLNLPLTGALAFLGEGYKMGIVLAIEELGGAIQGHPIELYDADNKGTPTDSVNAVRQLVDVNQVQVMIGGGASSATLASMPIILEGETPSVDGSSTNPTIYNQIGVGGNPWLFRIGTDDLIMGQGYSDYIADRVKSVSFVGDDNQFGRGAGQVYVPLLPRSGAEVLSEDYFDPGTADYRPALTKIKSTGADAVLIVMTDQSCATFMRQFREVGLTQQVFARGGCTTGLFNENTKDDPKIGEGIIEFSFFMSGSDPDFADRFFKRYNQQVTSHRFAGYYAMYHTVAPAIEAVLADGKELTPANIRDAIAALDVDTAVGKIKFDDHNQAYTKGSLTTNKDGKQVFLDEVELKPIDHTGF
ncbi:MAG: ABC transporter substrate-binding protein [Anaerolineaceae bacterium]|nr:ABC transporter substrate-binding protein [Anaerolineaceae bacterium]